MYTDLDIRSVDPLNILRTTRGVLEHAKFVSLNPDALPAAAERVHERYAQGLGTPAEAVGATGEFATDIQRVFIQDAVNFSFWPRPGEAKWRVIFDGREATGWYAIVACVNRALAEGVPVLNANYLAEVSAADLRQIFRGEGGTALPMLPERAAALRETGAMLRNRFGGSFKNMIAEARGDAIELVELIVRHFPLFRDTATLGGEEVVFLKRSQIVANDLHYVLRESATPLKNVDQLTAFADYKLPQVLRHFDVLRYADDLAERVDNRVELPAGSRDEIEIRAATIWAVELLRERLKSLTAADVDNALWLLGRKLASSFAPQRGATEANATMRPHHRTRTIWY